MEHISTWVNQHPGIILVAVVVIALIVLKFIMSAPADEEENDVLVISPINPKQFFAKHGLTMLYAEDGVMMLQDREGNAVRLVAKCYDAPDEDDTYLDFWMIPKRVAAGMSVDQIVEEQNALELMGSTDPDYDPSTMDTERPHG